MFKVDQNIQNDSIFLKSLELSELYLKPDSEVDWFVLVPRIENMKEITDLNMNDQQKLLVEINYVAKALEENSHYKKLNIANLGNIVSQLHIHIIARKENDRGWPGPIWGVEEKLKAKRENIDLWKNYFSTKP